MNYQAIYERLCNRGREGRCLPGRVERHHIIPRHVGGDDSSSNLTNLTPREHCLAHALLYRMHGRWQDKLALNAMRGHCPDARSEAQRQAGLQQLHEQRGIHHPDEARFNCVRGLHLAEWNRLHPEGQQRGLDKCHERSTQLRMARSKAAFVYVDPTGKRWLSRVEAAEAFGVKAFSIENWGKRQHYGWRREPV